MPVALQLLVFCLAAAVSLATSHLLVTRLERIGERLGLSEALLGMVAALAADAPEVTSAVTVVPVLVTGLAGAAGLARWPGRRRGRLTRQRGWVSAARGAGWAG